MVDYPIQTIIDDLKENRKAAIKALCKGNAPGHFDFDMKLVQEIAALHGAILALEAQRDEDSDWESGPEPDDYPDS